MAAAVVVTKSSFMAAAAVLRLLFLLGCLPALATAVSFSYSSFSNASNVTLKGSAAFGNAGCINITENSGNTTGWVSYPQPVQLRDADTKEVASFTTRFSFTIIPNNRDTKGDGMAFFLVSYPSTMPDVPPVTGGSLGLAWWLANNDDLHFNASDNRFVAVEFDTFNNSIDPNVKNDHIGIDVSSITSVKNEPLPNFSLIGNMTADVHFDADSSILSTQLWINYSTTPYNLSYNVDVTRELPEKVAVGLSASTGAAFELHQLCSWSFNSSFRQKQQHSGGVVAGVTAGAALLVVLLFAITAVLVRRRRTKKRREADQEAENEGSDGDGDPIGEIEMGTGPRRFPYHQLVNATKSFAAEEKLGQGGFGAVYRGHLSELGLAVAIKRFAKESSGQGWKEYTSEIKVISRLRHRNLVQLIGWCHGRGELLLVYELVPNRSLDIHLHDHGNGTFLAWPMSLLGCEKNGVFRLVEWAWDLYGRGAVLTAADERLNGEYDAAEMERVIAVGLWCAHPDPSARPSIRAAMAALQFSGQPPVLPPKMPVPTYAPPVTSLDGLFASSTGTSLVQSSTTTSSHATHTSCSSDSSASAGLKDSASLLKHQY
ncbi:hypothetical protein ABZP36_025567 [Zizania latifolia]